MKTWMVAFGLTLAFASVACVGIDPAEDEATDSESALENRPTTPGVTEGGACKINSGPNSGSSGTYDTTTDPGHVWCCTGAGGAGSARAASESR